MDEPWDDFERKSTREEVFVLFRGDQERVERKVRKSQITIERLSMMPDWNLCSARGRTSPRRFEYDYPHPRKTIKTVCHSRLKFLLGLNSAPIYFSTYRIVLILKTSHCNKMR